MKRTVLPAVLVLLALSAGAEAQTTVPAKPNMFSTLTACRQALASGQFRFYEPKYFGLKERNPTNDADRIVVPLESDTCLEMLVVGGRQVVAQREGTLFRARRLADGSLALYARNDCGNPVYGVMYPALPAPPEEPAPRDPVVLSAAPLRRDPPLRLDPPQPSVPATMRPVLQDGSSKKKGGFCSSKKCRWTVGILAASAAGYAAYEFWPCPPGTVRR